MKDWALIVAVTATMVLGTVGFGFMVSAVLAPVKPLDDSDCRAESSVDERDPKCREFCESVPVWYWLGSRDQCYWDDAEAKE